MDVSPDSPLDTQQPVFLDTETTGTDVTRDEVLSVCLLNYDGTVLLDTLVRPLRHKRWSKAQAVNGITPEQVLAPGVPTFAEVAPRLAELLRGRLLVAYNAPFDCAMIAPALALGAPADIRCAMEEFAPVYGDWNEHHQDYRWVSLETAARFVLHTWQGKAHGAQADCRALRDVWEFVHWPLKREAVADERVRRAERAEVRAFLARQQAQLDAAQLGRNLAWSAAYAARLGPAGSVPVQTARESAEVFCPVETGYPLYVWQGYGARVLRLRRYAEGAPRRPAYLQALDTWNHHYLRPSWHPGSVYQAPPAPRTVLFPAAMLIVSAPDEPLRLQPLYDVRKLRLGVDYVPYSRGDWPEGHASRTMLRRQYKVKEKVAAALLPTFARWGKEGPYLLYPVPAPTSAAANVEHVGA